MIEIKFTGDDFIKVRKDIQEFAINHLNMKFGVTVAEGQLELTPAAANPPPIDKKPKKTKVQTEAASPVSSPAAAVVDSSPAAVPSAPAEVGPLTHPDCVGALEKVYNKYGMEKSLEILSRFGVKRARELKDHQYRPFVELCHQTAGA